MPFFCRITCHLPVIPFEQYLKNIILKPSTSITSNGYNLAVYQVNLPCVTGCQQSSLRLNIQIGHFFSRIMALHYRNTLLGKNKLLVFMEIYAKRNKKCLLFCSHFYTTVD